MPRFIVTLADNVQGFEYQRIATQIGQIDGVEAVDLQRDTTEGMTCPHGIPLNKLCPECRGRFR
jgi:hypothetical protein